ncbi:MULTISPECIES: hypothetical protein [unclassified Nocardia]|uniref:hypothetical protein n=1 Tax=unclassified Nocardia TaxID=2637762 RepID=UPI001CE3BFBF|nr:MULTISPECIES: hypothetical protein [unclassified Nocardia]
MTGESVTTLYDFQLSMLHAMSTRVPSPGADLLERIGATRTETRMAEIRWWGSDATNKFSSIGEYVTAWGAPDSDRVERHGDREIRYAGRDLPFWPGLRIEWMELSHHPTLFRQLLRHPDCPRPKMESIADLTPWSCTGNEIHDGTLGPTHMIDGWGGPGDIAVFRAIDPDSGHNRVYRAHFDWCLLQFVEPAPDTYEWWTR